MSWITSLFSLEHDLDTRATRDLEALANKLAALNGNVNQLTITLRNIIKAKKEGRVPSRAVRENFLETLQVMRRELEEAEHLERDAEHVEQLQERQEAAIVQKEISMSMVRRKSPLPFTIGSAHDCDEKISRLSPHHVLIVLTEDNFGISARGTVLCVPQGKSLDQGIEVSRRPIQINQNCTLYLIVNGETAAIIHLVRD